METVEFESWSADRLAEIAEQGIDARDPDPVLSVETGDRVSDVQAEANRRKRQGEFS